jgi:hypothetical protein
MKKIQVKKVGIFPKWCNTYRVNKTLAGGNKWIGVKGAVVLRDPANFR